MAEPYKKDHLRVGYCNLAAPPWAGLEDRLDVIQDAYKELKADLLGLGEATEFIKQILTLKDPMMYIHLGEKAEDSDIYNAVAYKGVRFSRGQSEALWLNETGKAEKDWDASREHGATWCKLFDAYTDQHLILINTHLDTTGVVSRTKSIEMIIDKIVPLFPDYPIILTADSNVNYDSPDERWRDEKMRKPYELMLAAGFEDCWTATHPDEKRPRTFHGFGGENGQADKYGTYDPDWIFARGFKVHSCEVITTHRSTVYPSDHFWMSTHLQYA